MFDFNKKRSNKVLVWIIVGLLVACMVVPTAYYLIATLLGGAA